ncbi:MAG: hypothetical protein ACI9H8_001573 [Lysobacterales bacterium]|jgi:hypothetical protein
MKQVSRKTLLICLAWAFPFGSLAMAQSQSLASTMDVYVFPSQGQDSGQQSKDEAECYQWAVSNTGSDPFDLAKQEQANEQQAQADMQAAQQAGQGAAQQGRRRGAVGGALIGEIADDDAGKGAAYGAVIGASRGRRQAAAAQQQATAQASSQAESREAATGEQLGNFKKAFSVCLEAHDYMVKY